MVDARRDVLRAVHDHARQHGRERRAAVDPARPARVALEPRVDRQRVHAHASPCCWSPAAGWATSSAAGACSCSAWCVFAALERRHRPRPHDTWLVAGRAVQGIGAAFMMPAHPLDHLQHVPARTSAAARSARGPACPRWRSRSARWSAARSPSTCPGARSSSSTCRWRRRAVVVTLFATQRVARRDRSTARWTSPASPALSVGLTALVLALVEGNELGLGLAPDHRRCSPLASSAWSPSWSIETQRARADGAVRVLQVALVLRRELDRVHRLVRDARDVLLHRRSTCRTSSATAPLQAGCASCPRR